MRWFEDGTLHFGVGIEDTFIPQTRPGERPIDEYELTEHYRFWHEDLGLAAQAGAGFVRWGVPWYRICPEKGTWDWGWLDRVMARFAELGVRPVVDLMHYGTPLWLEGEFGHPDYPKLVAEYSVRVAERYAATVTDYTPVNEPMIHALFSGSHGYWPPYLTGGAGFTTMARVLAEGLVLAQQGMAEVLGAQATFVHVDAGMRYAGDVHGEHRETVARLRHQAHLVEDLVNGRVGPEHPLSHWLSEHGMPDAALTWFADHPARPDVIGVNYYPLHSTEVFEEGVSHDGGFADPRPTMDDGVVGLAEVLTAYEERYGTPVALTETCVTGTVAERLDWLDRSVACVHGLRAGGHRVVGYTWWPLFDMYEWTYRYGRGPRQESRLTMGLWDLVEDPGGLLRRKNAVADRFRSHATGVRAPDRTDLT